MSKLKITQALSPQGNTYLIYQWNDKNTLDCFEIYKLVGNQKDVAREFGISDINPNGGENFNTRVMCEKMIEVIENNKLNSHIQKLDCNISNITEKKDIIIKNDNVQNNQKVFDLRLRKSYFNGGFINIPKKYNNLFAAHGEPIEIIFSNYVSNDFIDRTTNNSNSPRIHGRNQLKKWFQTNFKMNDLIHFEVINPNKIRIFK